MIDVAAYLHRIAYAGPLAPTAETLRGLHLAHLLAVPFENLDIGLGRPIALDEAALFDKIVARRRGGFCYELNGLFAALLRALGFDVALLSARVAHADGGFGPPFDHLTLLVTFPKLAGSRLADVGFGDSFRTPLLFQEAIEQLQEGHIYRLTRDAEDWTLLRRPQGDRDGRWEAQYRFTTRPHRWADFAEMCRYHQTAPESPFTRRRTCSRATPQGRITLSDGRLIVTERGERQERPLSGEGDYAAALRELFGIVLND
jgi:N-hydroxyarylamine O-acetyltransferase